MCADMGEIYVYRVDFLHFAFLVTFLSKEDIRMLPLMLWKTFAS